MSDASKHDILLRIIADAPLPEEQLIRITELLRTSHQAAADARSRPARQSSERKGRGREAKRRVHQRQWTASVVRDFNSSEEIGRRRLEDTLQAIVAFPHRLKAVIRATRIASWLPASIQPIAAAVNSRVVSAATMPMACVQKFGQLKVLCCTALYSAPFRVKRDEQGSPARFRSPQTGCEANMIDDEPAEVLTTGDLEKMLKIPRKTQLDLRARGGFIPHFFAGHKVLHRKEAVLAWIAEQEAKAAGGKGQSLLDDADRTAERKLRKPALKRLADDAEHSAEKELPLENGEGERLREVLNPYR